jgi:hypothetical protein
MKTIRTKTKLTPKQMDYEQLDMLGVTDKELTKIMTPVEIEDMKDYLANKQERIKSNSITVGRKQQ